MSQVMIHILKQDIILTIIKIDVSQRMDSLNLKTSRYGNSLASLG